ncbi:hypothetical protein NDU88_004392 [Pleurodeles waltl]|uniref:Uncharacterized protein n=1 Tax=Pleurodeles waltl TaxID=8319 RepID=A0AAV7PFL6_PLEWA|nr:hypothetical protein NDU88_004392 [Pleurodeles waltl]
MAAYVFSSVQLYPSFRLAHGPTAAPILCFTGPSCGAALQDGAREPDNCQRAKGKNHPIRQSRAVRERTRLARVHQATPRRLADGSNARNGVAASSPHLATNDGVRVSAPARPEHCSVQLG